MNFKNMSKAITLTQVDHYGFDIGVQAFGILQQYGFTNETCSKT
jgi:hypothetical protein